jgi:hypothetical protein
LVNSPKKAFQSPGTHSRTAPAPLWSMILFPDPTDHSRSG